MFALAGHHYHPLCPPWLVAGVHVDRDFFFFFLDEECLMLRCECTVCLT